MAHVNLTVNRFDAARAFYGRLLPFLGMELVFDGKDMFYHVGGRTAVGIQRGAAEHADASFEQLRVGLHHLCFRARSRQDIDRCAELLRELDATIVRGPLEGGWAPGYYYVLFEDPDGIRLEINHVPGQGVLAEGQSFDPGQDYS